MAKPLKINVLLAGVKNEINVFDFTAGHNIPKSKGGVIKYLI